MLMSYSYNKIINYLNFNNWWRDIKCLEITALNHDQEGDMIDNNSLRSVIQSN
jgi:hypothetical protein